ncbi:hypothetical protein ACJJTC_015084, partial [Scirpophaga incertulas]
CLLVIVKVSLLEEQRSQQGAALSAARVDAAVLRPAAAAAGRVSVAECLLRARGERGGAAAGARGARGGAARRAAALAAQLRDARARLYWWPAPLRRSTVRQYQNEDSSY